MIVAEASFEGEKVNPNNSKFPFDGSRLTNLKINAMCTSRDDIEELIQYLEVHKFCFDKK